MSDEANIGNSRRGWAHRNGPDTQHEGAEHARDTGGQVRTVVWGLLHEFPEGLIDEELTQLCQDRHVGSRSRGSVSARRRDLMNDGLVRDSGRRRRSTYGIRNVVWQVVPEDERVAKPTAQRSQLLRLLRAAVKEENDNDEVIGTVSAVVREYLGSLIPQRSKGPS